MDVAEYDRDEIKAVLKEKAIELFKICDKDGKNYITKDDLLELTRELALTQEQVEFAFEKLDTDKNNFLTLDEFIDGFGLFLGVENEEEIDPETQLKYANAQELFDLCDEGSKGYVTKSDLTRLISELNLTSEQVNQIFDELDEDKNGFLTIYEFVNGFLDFVKENKTYEDQTDLTNSNSNINNLQNGYDKSQPETEVYGYRDRSDTNSSSSGRGLYQRQKSVDLLDPDAKQLFEKVGEDFSDALTKEQLKDLWRTMRRHDALALSNFETFLVKVSGEIRKAKNDTLQLESALKRKTIAHDIEVQKLYEEMEQQIRNERARIKQQDAKREKAIKEDLTSELRDKELQLQRMMNVQKEMEKKLKEVHFLEQDLKVENTKLLKEKSEMEEKLNESIKSLEETRGYISQLQSATVQEKQERLKVAVTATQGMQKEHESLIRQLDMLREMNQKLRDDRDAMEASFKQRRDRPTSLSDELQDTEYPVKKKLEKTGSTMSKYFSSGKRGSRTSSGRAILEKQGSVMSNYFGSNSVLTPEDEDNPLLVSGDGSDVDVDGSRHSWRDSWHGRLDSVLEEDDGSKGAELETASEQKTSTPIKNSEQDGESLENRSTPSPGTPRYGPVGMDGESESSQQHDTTLSPVEHPPENPNRVYKVVFVGDSGVGKSSFIHRFCFDDFKVNFSATIGVDFQVRTIKVNYQWVALQLWDTAGQERFRSLTKQYFRKADGIVVMFDLCSEASFTNVKGWMASIEEGAEADVILMMIGNKKDLADDGYRHITSTMAENVAKDYDSLYHEASAKSGEGASEAMTKLARRLFEKEDALMKISVLNLDMQPYEDKKKKKCCR